MKPTNEQIVIARMNAWKTRREMKDPWSVLVGLLEDAEYAYEWTSWGAFESLMHHNRGITSFIIRCTCKNWRASIEEDLAWFKNNKHKWE